MKLRSAALLGWLALATACGGDVERLPSGFPERDPLVTPPDATRARGPACSLYACFEACGARIGVAPLEPAFGFSDAGSAPREPFASAVLSDERVLIDDGLNLWVRRASDAGALGRMPLGSAYALAALGDTGLAQTRRGGMAEIDLSAPDPSVRAWWFDASDEQPAMRLLGAAGGRFALELRGGVSLIEPSASGPRETACLSAAAGSTFWGAALIGDVLAIAQAEGESDPSSARLFRLVDGTPNELPSLPVDDEIPFLGAGDRLVLQSDNRRRLTLYDLSGDAPSELAVADGVPTGSDLPRAFGGFEFRGSEDEIEAFDLQNGLERFWAERVPGMECAWRLRSQVSARSFVVSQFSPDRRWPGDAPPALDCPTHFRHFDPRDAALSPDGTQLLFADGSGEGWVYRDLATGSERLVPAPANGALHWIGDRVIASGTTGSDWGITVRSMLNVVVVSAPQTASSEVQTPGPLLALSATERELWGLSYAENFVYGEAAPRARRLFRLDPASTPPELSVLPVNVDDVTQLSASGERGYLVSRTRLRVVERSGQSLSELDTPAEITSSTASASGWFGVDAAEHLWWLPAGGNALVPLTDSCPACVVVGADEARVLVRALSPRDARHLQVRDFDEQLALGELLAYAPSPTGGTLVGRHPIPDLQGSPLLVGGGRAYTLPYGALLALQLPAP